MGHHVLDDHDSAMATANAELRGNANSRTYFSNYVPRKMECYNRRGHRWERLSEYQEGYFLMERMKCKVCHKKHDFLWQRHADGQWHPCYR